ncbi:uncharacterized protein LOC119190685 [Manduca sexta]|uniref:uncharacterized protein LOC119190685 n=1 Tax=Manduca sexta TaxID=7130 RepID=UPI00189098B7|nr:uncharacterized protein LOC119190685 [Manduca sexta]
MSVMSRSCIKQIFDLIYSAKALLPPSALTVQLGVGLVFLAMFSFFISFMGFYGAISRSQFLLFMYATLNMLVLLLECALLFYFSSNLVEKGQREGDQWTHTLRLTFKCCELNVTQQDVQIPWSCCGVVGYPNNCTSSTVFQDVSQHTIINSI